MGVGNLCTITSPAVGSRSVRPVLVTPSAVGCNDAGGDEEEGTHLQRAVLRLQVSALQRAHALQRAGELVGDLVLLADGTNATMSDFAATDF